MRLKLNISPILMISLALLLITNLSFAQKKNKGKTEEQKEVTKYERANAEYLLIDAQKYFLLEDYKKAEAFLKQSLGIDANNHAAYFKLAEIYLINSENQKGLDAITMALSMVKDNKYYYLLAAQLYKQKNDFASAALAYEQMIENTTDYFDYLLDLSDVYVALKQYDKAISTIESLEAKFGENGRFTLQKVSLLLSANRADEAIDLVKTLIEAGREDEAFILEYANLVSSYRSVQEAIDFLEAREPSSKSTLFLVRLYLDINRNEKAATLITTAIDDSNIDMQDKLTLINDFLDNPTLANDQQTLITLQTSLEQQYPNKAEVLEMSGRVYLQLAEANIQSREEFQNKAILSFIKVKDLDPSDFEVWTRILKAEYEAEDWTNLLKHSNEALDLYPNQGLFYFYNGSAYMETNDADEALNALNQGVKLTHNNPTLGSRLRGKHAELLLMQGDQDQAFQMFETALNQENSHPEVLNTYSFQLALRKIDLTKALEISEQLLGLDRSSQEYLYTRGFVLFQAEQFMEAERLIANEDLEKNGEGRLLELYGDVLFKLNKVDEALEQWQNAKAAGGTSDKIDQKIATKQYYE